MNISLFGYTAAGQRVDRVVLDSGSVRCGIITYGGVLQFLEAPDKNGDFVDVVLGYDTVADYEKQDKFMGALVGRCANRIRKSRFTLNGTEYRLFANNGENHLHGGEQGFDRKLWTAQEVPNGVRLTLKSPHMEEGYPGNLDVAVTYTLEGCDLTIWFEAVSDRNTVCNLTSHAYFDLDGQGGGRVLDHELKLFSKEYTPVSDSASIPTGEIAAVAGTPMDFRNFTPIGKRIDEDFDQLVFGSGYDHNWVVEGQIGKLRPAAKVFSPHSGISLTVETTMPGVQFYSGNSLSGGPVGKGGAVYGRRDGFCLETQFYPDSINHSTFPQPVLREGERWEHTTVFRFGKK